MDFQIVHMLFLQVGFWFLTVHAELCLTLSNHMVAFFSMGLQNSYTHTLWPGFRFSLAMHIFGLHSLSRYWILKVFLFSILIFHGVFILALLDQVLGSHSPCAYLIDTLQAGIGFFFFLIFFLVQSGFFMVFSSSHSPNRFYVLT